VQLACGVRPPRAGSFFGTWEGETPLFPALTAHFLRKKKYYLDNPLAFLHPSPPTHVESKFNLTGGYGECRWAKALTDI